MNDPGQPQSWMAKAESDFLVIQACLGTGDIKPWDMIAFHAQQGAEKYLKAFLVSRMPGDPPRTHDLPTLLSQCTAFEHSLSALGADCVLLNQHAIGPRYPGMPEPSASDALAAVAAAERIRTEIRQRLGMENV